MPIRNHHDMLEYIAKSLDIPLAMYESAARRYKEISEWIGRRDSTLSNYNIQIFPQGSVLLGTVTRPFRSAEQYDIDVVCRVEASKSSISQRELKEAVGEEVRSYAMADEHAILPLEEGRICWALQYEDDAQFHLDIVPALPNEDPYREMLRRSGYVTLADSAELSGQAIAITDNTLPQYPVISQDWPSSNPLGYAMWFRRCMRQRFVEARKALAASRAAAHVDDIPEYEVKTPLQRAVQILKRHRDIFFDDQPKRKPASIIVTTLAAHAYRDVEDNIASALADILRGMQDYIDEREGVAWIPNPVYPSENLADGWTEAPERRRDFDRWLSAARQDFGAYLRASRYDELPQDLRQRLGTDLVDRALQLVAPVAAVAMENEAVRRATTEARAVREAGQASKPWVRR